MAIKQPRINSAEQLEGRRHPTAKLERGTRTRADSKAGHATPVRAGNSQAPAIVPAAAETVVAEAETVVVEAEGIGSAIAVHPPAPVPREAQWVMARAGATEVRRVPAVRVAAPA